ncbi:MAG: hypothetical protein L0154_25275 [Chloroflexi bacterium]|nr:hypothetical protein [Chloroflexota bacterium]
MGDKKKIQGRVLKAHIYKKGEGFTGEVVTHVVSETAREMTREEFEARVQRDSQKS